MVKLIRLGVLVAVAAVAFPRIAAAELTNRELRQTVSAAEYWLTVEFPLSAAIECDQQRYGASGTWDVDSRCNVELERIAALISLVTGGTFVVSDAVTAWCSAAEIVNSAKEALASFRRGPDMSEEARNQRAWESLAPYQQNSFIALNTTLGFLLPLFEFEE
jgi:hypothetical protein